MKDESARDKAIENVLGQKLRARATPGNGCPDAEILAAYFERTLPQKDRAKWETHFDSCAACQQRIAALVRMDEAGEASISHPSAKPASQLRKRFLLRWAWAAPLLLVVLVAGLWYTREFDPIFHSRTETVASTSKTTAASAKPAELPSPANKDAKTSPQAPMSTTAASQAATRAPGPLAATDQLKPDANAPTSGAAPKQLASPPAPSPAPPSAAMDVEAERKLKEREAGSAGSGAGSATGSVQDLPVNGRNTISLEKTQTTVSPSSQATSSTAGVAAPQRRLAQAAPQAGPTASTAGGAVGGVLLGKVENAPPPPPKSAEATFAARDLLGGTRSKKAGLATPATPPETQASFGTVRGSVRDASGAAISRATVIAVNNSTNVAKLITTNEAGEYTADLDPGDYTLEAAAQGFQSLTVKDIPLQARADRKLDFSLQVGQETQTVTVAAASPAVQTTSPLWRVGPHGLIQKRSGQGEWETKPSGVAVDLFDINFPSRNIGWAVGQGGTVLRSANGGETWGRVASPTSEDLVSVRATGDEAAEVLTRSGIEFITTDGATTWIRTGKTR